MPAKPAQEPERTPAATTAKEADAPAADAPTPAETVADDVPAGRLPAGVYEFVGTIPTQYLEVPLTARPEVPGRAAVPATAEAPEIPAVPPAPATVFDWPFSAPGDGRWKPSKKKPNQLPDNAPADTPEGE